jgi:hypothetical protein
MRLPNFVLYKQAELDRFAIDSSRYQENLEHLIEEIIEMRRIEADKQFAAFVERIASDGSNVVSITE